MNQDQEPRRVLCQNRSQPLTSRFADLARYAGIDDNALRERCEKFWLCMAGRGAAAGSETVAIGHDDRIAGERPQGNRRRARHEHEKDDAQTPQF